MVGAVINIFACVRGQGFGEVDRTDALFLQGREDRFVVCGRGERWQFVREHLRCDRDQHGLHTDVVLCGGRLQVSQGGRVDVELLGVVSAELVHEVMVFADVDTAGFAFADSKLRIGLDRDPAVTKRNLIGQVIFQAVCEITRKNVFEIGDRHLREIPFFPLGIVVVRRQRADQRGNGQQQADKNGDDAGFGVFLIFSLCFL